MTLPRFKLNWFQTARERLISIFNRLYAYINRFQLVSSIICSLVSRRPYLEKRIRCRSLLSLEYARGLHRQIAGRAFHCVQLFFDWNKAKLGNERNLRRWMWFFCDKYVSIFLKYLWAKKYYGDQIAFQDYSEKIHEAARKVIATVPDATFRNDLVIRGNKTLL